MRKLPTLLLAGGLAAAGLASTRDARALGPLDLELGGKVGVGTNPFTSGNVQGPNPLGFGLGARAGIQLLGIYGGVNLVYYFGGSQDVTLPAGGAVSVSEHALQYGVEVGYGLKLLILTIRPQVGLGNFSFTSSGSLSGAGASGSGSNTASNFYVEPGVTGLVSLGTLFVGADANLLVLPGITDPSTNQSSTDTAFTLHAQVGVKF